MTEKNQDDENRQDDENKQDYSDSIRGQFLYSMILIISLISFVVLAGIDSGMIHFLDAQNILDSIYKIFLYLLLIIGLIILLVLFGILIRFTYESIEQVIVFPFDSSDKNIDGNSMADILITELARIKIIHSKEFELSSSDRLPLSSQDAITDVVLANELSNLNKMSDTIKASLGGVDNFGIGSITLPVGPILTALQMIRPIGEKGCIIRGSISKNGDDIYIISHVNKDKYSFNREIRAKSDFHKILRDLAFKIAHKFSRIPLEEKNQNGEKPNEAKDITQGHIPAASNPEGKNIKCPADEIADGLKKIIQETYMFSWEKIPGRDSEVLAKFLAQRFGIGWIQTAKSERIDNNTIKISTKKNSLSLKLSDDKTNVILEIDDGGTNKFISKVEINDLNIYQEKMKQEAKKEIDNLNLYTKNLQKYLMDEYIECPASDKYFFGKNDLIKPGKFVEEIYNNNDAKHKNNDALSKILKEKIDLDHKEDKLYIIQKLNEFIKDNGIDVSKNNELIKIMRPESKKIMKKCKSKGPKRKGKCFHLKRLLLEDAYPKHLKLDIPKSWEDLKYLTEAKDYYNQYVVTQDRQFLDESKSWCNKVSTGKDFGILFSLSYNLGIAYFDESDYKNAEEMFSKASSLNASANAYAGEGFALRYQSKYKEAIDAFKRAIYFDDEIAPPWNLLGSIYLGLGAYADDLYDKSIACLSESIKRDPDNPYPWLYLCLNYSRKAALQKDRKTREFYVDIALECIENAIGFARSLGLKKFPTIATAKAACLLQRGNESDIKKAKNILLYNYSLQKTPFNKACLLYLLDRKNEAKKFIEEALRKDFTSRAQILFDPDIYEDKSPNEDKDSGDPMFPSKETSLRFQEIKKLLKNYQDNIIIMENIRDILSKESKYIRASFEAISGNNMKAIDYLKEIKADSNKYDLERFEKDWHFESIHDFAIVVTARLDPVIGSVIEIAVEVFCTTSEVPLTDIHVFAKFYGLNRYPSTIYSKELDPINKQFESEKAVFHPYVDGNAHKNIIIDVKVRAKKGKNQEKCDEKRLRLNPKQS
jgi:tetratricopeptide (TPR) repeat protein